VHISIIVKIHLLPSDGGLSGPIKSIQTTENGVPITGNEPNGAFATVPFDTFLWHKSHDDPYLNTKLLKGNSSLKNISPKINIYEK